MVMTLALLVYSVTQRRKLRQHMVYVYASLSRLDFQGLLENAIVVF